MNVRDTLKKVGVYKLLVFLLFILPLSSCAEQEQLNFSGILEAEQYYIVSEVQGRVAQILKSEGETLKKGEIYAKIDPASFSFTVKQLEENVAAKSAKLEELVNGARAEEIQIAMSAVKQAEAALESSRKVLEAAQINLNDAKDKYEEANTRYKDLKATEDELKDYKLKLEQTTYTKEEAFEKVQSAKATLDGAKSRYQLLLNGATSQAVKIASADLEAAKSALEGARVTLAKYSISAPAEGVLSMKNIRIGEVVNPGSTLGELIDMSDKYVKIYIPQKWLAKVSLGKALVLNDYSDKRLKVSGKVSFISPKAEYTPKNIERNEEKENTVFLVKIEILDKNPALKPGMTFETNL